MGDWDVVKEESVDPWGVAKQQKARPGWGELASDVGGYLKGIGQEAVRTPVEAYQSAKQDLSQGSLPHYQPNEGFWEGLGKDIMDKPAQMGRTLRGVATAAGLPLAPVYGAAKAAIGRPLANVIHKAGEYINPEQAAQHTPEDIYEDIREDVGSALGTVGARTVGTKMPKVAVPSLAERKAAAKAAYNHPVIKTAEIKPQSVHGLTNAIEGDLITAGFRPVRDNALNTFREIRQLRPSLSLAARKGLSPVLIADLDATRRVLGKYARQVDAAGAATTEANAAQQAIGHIDDFLLNLKQSDLHRGNANRIGQILGEARKDWASYKREQLVDTLEANADAARASTYGGGNANNAIRQKFRPLTMNNSAKMKGWSPEAKEAVATVVSGGPQYSAANVSRQIGRFSPSGPVGLLGHLGSLYGLGPVVAVPLATAAYAAKKLGIALTRSNVEKVRDILAKESALYKSRQAAARPIPRRNIGAFAPAGWTQIPYRADELAEPSQNPYAP